MTSLRTLIPSVSLMVLATLACVGLVGCSDSDDARPLTILSADSDSNPSGEDEVEAVAEPPVEAEVAPAAMAEPTLEVEAEVVPTEILPRLTVVSGAIGMGVEKRVPIDVGTVFDTDAGTLVAHVGVRNLDSPSQIQMIWKRDGVVSSSMSLDVGVSPRWRTWSKKRIRSWDTGEWTVEVRDAEGDLLKTMEFEVVEAQLDDDEFGCSQ